MKRSDLIEIEEGGGGSKSEELIASLRKNFPLSKKWKNIFDDGAVLDLKNFLSGKKKEKKLVFTTDSFIVDPLFFPGGDIGKISFCGTINDLAVMGAVPLGISLSLVLEEGFSRRDFLRIVRSIGEMSRVTGVPVVTGDTKVTEKGKLDKIEITTAGVGLAEKIVSNGGVEPGDVIFSSGDLGEHTVTLLAKRFDYKTRIKSDCRPLIKEIQAILKYLHSCKDPTRGGMATVLLEMAEKSGVKIVLEEERLPFKKETSALAGILGIDKFSFASEGRFLGAVSQKDADQVGGILKKYNPEAKIIGRAEKGRGVWLKTFSGGFKKIDSPEGKLIPRIC